MWKPCGLYLQNISRIQSLLITSTVTILVKPPLSLAWMCTIVSSLDTCLLPCHAFPTPQFLLKNSSHLVPYQPESDHAPSQLSTLQWLPIWQRIKAMVLAVASKAPFGLAPPKSFFLPSPTSCLPSYLSLDPCWPWAGQAHPCLRPSHWLPHLPGLFFLHINTSTLLASSPFQPLFKHLFLSEANSDPPI